MPVAFGINEILETLRMIEVENLDIRTVTLGISLQDCRGGDVRTVTEKIKEKVVKYAGNLVAVADEIEKDYGVPIINKRVSVTPISLVAALDSPEEYVECALALDEAAKEVGVDFIGGFSALVHKGLTRQDKLLMDSIPEALAGTERVCSSVNVATTRAGINMDAVYEMGKIIKRTAALTADADSIGCAKLVVFCNIPEDNPFMAGALHGVGEPEATINVGVSGPGSVLRAIEKHHHADFGTLAEIIKKTAFKVTRMGELVGKEASERLNIPFGIVDLSLAPTPAVGDSVADILEAMGIARCGGPGTTAALAMLNDAVKKGGAMATSYVGGLSGAFIPVSEDAGLGRAVESGALTLDKLEAMTSVCSVGLDMIALPGSISAEIIAAIIADEAAIGMVNHKTTAVRVIPVEGKKAGEKVTFGGLLGGCTIMPYKNVDPSGFVAHGGRIPAPIQALNN
ncbi:MAG TPA: PFL family protein [Clostridia bacterium]|nr:PFL family protein [Clostridia bacterium]